MSIYLNKKGQSTLEYGVVIAVVVAGLLLMQNYIKKGVQGKLKESADDIGSQYATNATSRTFSNSSTNSTTNTSAGDNPVTNSTIYQKSFRNSTYGEE